MCQAKTNGDKMFSRYAANLQENSHVYDPNFYNRPDFVNCSHFESIYFLILFHIFPIFYGCLTAVEKYIFILFFTQMLVVTDQKTFRSTIVSTNCHNMKVIQYIKEKCYKILFPKHYPEVLPWLDN